MPGLWDWHARMSPMQDQPVDAPPDAAAPPPSESYTDAATPLREAALHGLDQAHYGRAFERLDRAQRPLPLWNFAAALGLCGWMAYAGLWRWSAATAALALVAVGAMGLLQWHGGVPLPVLVGLALAVWGGMAVSAGMWGDALVHAQVRRQVNTAVSRAPTLQEAVNTLRDQAARRQRLGRAAVAALLVLFLALVVLGWGLRQRLPQEVVQEAGVEGGGTQEMATPQAQGRISEPPEVAPEAVAPAPPPEPVAEPVPTPAPEPPPESEQKPEQKPASTPVPPAPNALKKISDSTASVLPDQAAAVAAAPRRLYINVGMFADEGNARRTADRLRNQGLPVELGVVRQSSGRRLQRVRVGPYQSSAQANEAAAQVRALGLEAAAAAVQ